MPWLVGCHAIDARRTSIACIERVIRRYFRSVASAAAVMCGRVKARARSFGTVAACRLFSMSQYRRDYQIGPELGVRVGATITTFRCCASLFDQLTSPRHSFVSAVNIAAIVTPCGVDCGTTARNHLPPIANPTCSGRASNLEKRPPFFGGNAQSESTRRLI